MEIIGRNVPSFRSAIETVASGIQESTQVRGPESIQSAFETFSPSTLGTLGTPELMPAVADVAQFPEPLQYFQAQVQRNIEGGSGSLQKEFLDVLQDKKFDPNSELAGIAKNDMFDMLSKKTESTGPYFNVPPPPERGTIAWVFLTSLYPRTLQYYEQQWERREELLKQTPTPAENDALQKGTTSQQAAFSELKNTPLQSNVSGKVLDSDKIAHLFPPPKQSVPRPQPAVIAGPKGPGAGHSTTTPSYIRWFEGSADQSDAIKNASEKAKAEYIPKEPEYLSPDKPITYGPGNSPGGRLNEFFDHFNKLRASEISGRGDQTETIKYASEKAKASYTPKEPEYLQGEANISKSESGSASDADQRGIIIVGGKIPGGDKLQHFNVPSEPTLPHPSPARLVHSDSYSAAPVAYPRVIKESADQTDTIKNASEKAKAPYTPEEPEYLSGKHEIPKSDPQYMFSQHEIDEIVGKGPLSTEQIDKMMKEGLRVPFAPKEPEYLQGEPKITKPEGGFASNADQRGIIIVGGKSGGTYFDTIDDTLAQINQNPQPETIQLFEQQVGALQDLSSTVQKSIQMNQQVSSAITDRFRV